MEADTNSDRQQKVVAVLVILTVVLVYAYCLGVKGAYPPSHPWSGIALALLSLSLIRRSRRQVGLLWVSVGATVAAGLWALAAILSP
jgi:hypothetical protein